MCGSELFKLQVMPGVEKEGVETALRVAFSLRSSRFFSFLLTASCPGFTKVLTLDNNFLKYLGAYFILECSKRWLEQKPG